MQSSEGRNGTDSYFEQHDDGSREEEDSGVGDAEMRESRPWWNGNWNPVWVVGTAYTLLSVCYMGLAQFGHHHTAGFVIHTLVALSFVVTCALNLFHTPSHGPTYRVVHRWTGWIATFSGFFVVLSGYVIVLTGRSSLSSTANALFLGTGAMQIVVQVLLVVAMRFYQSAWYHMVCACVLFYGCTLMPAVNRAPQIFGFPDSDAFTFAIIPLGFLFIFFAIFFHSRPMMRAGGENEENRDTKENCEDQEGEATSLPDEYEEVQPSGA